jgi:hypothetical protein
MESGARSNAAMRAPITEASLLAGLLISVCVSIARAEPGTAPNSGVGTVGLGQPVVIQLPDGAAITFSPDGPYKAVVPNLQIGGSLAGSAATANATAPGPSASPTQAFQPLDLETLDLALRQSAANRCLTQFTFVCEPAPPSLAGRLNERSTRVSTSWLISQVGGELDRDAQLPAIQLDANPNPGITGIPTWFWVDRGTYQGQTFSDSNAITVPWTLYWDVIVHHHDVSSGPCSDDPSQTCRTTHDWDETVHHQEQHHDFISIAVDFSPAQFAWDFGDAQRSGESESHASFGDVKGMGTPYVNPHTPSPVAHNYRESSLRVYDQGGFPIQLSLTWSATATWHFTSDVGDNSSGTRTFGARVGQYTTRHQVRESQPVIVATYP